MSDIKKRFRSDIKNQTLHYLEQRRMMTHNKIRENVRLIQKVSKEQTELKKEASELHRIIEEYKK